MSSCGRSTLTTLLFLHIGIGTYLHSITVTAASSTTSTSPNYTSKLPSREDTQMFVGLHGARNGSLFYTLRKFSTRGQYSDLVSDILNDENPSDPSAAVLFPTTSTGSLVPRNKTSQHTILKPTGDSHNQTDKTLLTSAVSATVSSAVQRAAATPGTRQNQLEILTVSFKERKFLC